MHHDLYYPLSELEFHGCIATAQTTYFCKQHHPLYKKGSKISECEISILTQKTIASSCNFITTTDTPRWTQLHDPNQWIYNVKEEESINIICGTSVSQTAISGSGLITISKDCAIKDDSITIHGNELYTSSFNSALTPLKNLTELLPPKLLSKILYKPVPKENITNDIALLQEQLQHLKSQEVSLPKIHHATHYLSLGYSSLLMIITIVAYVSWNYYSKHRKPVPAPLTSINRFQLQKG